VTHGFIIFRSLGPVHNLPIWPLRTVEQAVALTFGRLLRLDLEHIALAINASIGGPPTAAAMAIAMGWSKLVLPALLIGIWGYTIGTLVGLAVGEVLQSWL
jgi:uncharacterized membrane protein